MSDQKIKIRVYGSDCPVCQRLDKDIQVIINELQLKNIDYRYVNGDKGVQAIVKLGIMHSPVLTINNQVVMVGSFQDRNKVKAKILPYLYSAKEEL